MHGSAQDLLDALANRGIDALVAGISGLERLGRADMYRDERQSVLALAGANPYRFGGSLIGDVVAAGRARRAGTIDEAAEERITTYRAVSDLQAANHQITTDTPGLLTTRPPGLPFKPGLPGTPLLALGEPFQPRGRTIELPSAWEDLPTGVLNPVEKTDVSGAIGTIPTVNTPVHMAAWSENISRQLLDFGEDALRRKQEEMETVVNVALEKALIAALVTAAGTPAADLDTAEAAAAAAWGTMADTLVVNPADWPAVRRSYSPQGVPFPNQAITGSIAAGVALVFPLSAIWLLVEPMRSSAATEPSVLGEAMGFSRAGVAASRRTGAIGAATLV